jgi:hypothetical protein
MAGLWTTVAARLHLEIDTVCGLAVSSGTKVQHSGTERILRERQNGNKKERRRRRHASVDYSLLIAPINLDRPGCFV